jgi:hypothetical protein
MTIITKIESNRHGRTLITTFPSPFQPARIYSQAHCEGDRSYGLDFSASARFLHFGLRLTFAVAVCFARPEFQFRAFHDTTSQLSVTPNPVLRITKTES